MKVFIDTNVILDIWLERSEFSEYSKDSVEACELGQIEGFSSWHSISNLYYITLDKLRDEKAVKSLLGGFLKFIQIPKVNEKDAQVALTLPIKDYEDALQVVTAKAGKVDVLITRNKKDFKKSGLDVFTPKEFVGKFL